MIEVGDKVRLLVHPTGEYEVCDKELIVDQNYGNVVWYRLRNRFGIITGRYREEDLTPIEIF